MGHATIDRDSRILLADDEPSFRDSTAELLREDGFRCDAASDAYQAAELLAQRPYDLLIADIRMPGNRKLEFVEQVLHASPGMPVILVTGYPSTETAISSIHLPVVAYLKKPLPYNDLRRQIDAALVHSPHRRAILRTCDQLRQCLDDLNEVVHLRWASLDKSGCGSVRVPHATLRTLAACVSELVALEVSGGTRAHLARTCELLECPRWPAHRRAIGQAVALVNETKRRFKSKELARVKEILENLLEESD